MATSDVTHAPLKEEHLPEGDIFYEGFTFIPVLHPLGKKSYSCRTCGSYFEYTAFTINALIGDLANHYCIIQAYELEDMMTGRWGSGRPVHAHKSYVQALEGAGWRVEEERCDVYLSQKWRRDCANETLELRVSPRKQAYVSDYTVIINNQQPPEFGT